MADKKEQVIIDIQIDYEEGIANMAKYRAEADKFRQANADLRKELKAGNITQEECNLQIAENSIKMREANDAASAWMRTIRNSLKADKEKIGSMTQMQAQLSLLTSRYKGLSEEERKSASGKALKDKINSLTNALKDNEEEIQIYNRNVGNYENAIKNATGLSGKFGEMLISSGGSFKVLQLEAKAATTAVGSLGKQFLALLANPIVLILAGIAVAIVTVKKAINSSEEASNRWNVILAPLNRTLNFFLSLLQKGAGYILSFVEAGGKLLEWLSGLAEKLPVVGKYVKEVNDANREAINLAKEKADIEKQARVDEVQNAKDALEVARLRKEAKDKEGKTSAERLAAIQKANQLEEEASRRNVELAERRLKALQIESEWAENDAATNDELAKREAEVYRARQAYYQKTMELAEQENTVRNEIATAEKNRSAKAKEAAKKAMEIKAQEIDLLRKAEDMSLSLVRDGIEKQRKILNLQYDRQIEDLKRKLSTEKNLTDAARKAINDSIILADQKRETELKKLSDESLQDQIQKETERIQLQLDAVKAGTQQEHELRTQLIEQNRKEELAANLQLAEELRQSEADINAAYNKQIIDENEAFRKEQFDRQTEYIRLEWENRLLQAKEGSLQEYDLKIQQAQAEYDALINMDAATKAALYQSDAAYENAKLQSEKNLKDAIKDRINAENEAILVQMNAVSTITDAFSSMLESFAEDNEALAAFAKTVALFNIGINTAEAISKGVASAQAVGFPANIPAIATTIAAIMTNIAKAKQLLNKEKNPKFGSGGDISGPSHASGGVLIEAEGGEGIINKQSMSNPLLRSIASAVNVAGGGVPFSNVPIFPSVSGGGFDTAELKAIFVEALKEMPAPVVSVVEFTDAQNRVKMIQNNSGL